MTAATTTEAALSIGRRKTRVAIAALEVAVAVAIGRAKRRAIASAVEMSASVPISGRLTRSVLPADETNAAASLFRSKRLSVLSAVEIDVAQGAPKARSWLINFVSETDAASLVARRKASSIFAALEADTAPAVQLSQPNSLLPWTYSRNLNPRDPRDEVEVTRLGGSILTLRLGRSYLLTDSEVTQARVYVELEPGLHPARLGQATDPISGTPASQVGRSLWTYTRNLNPQDRRQEITLVTGLVMAIGRSYWLDSAELAQAKIMVELEPGARPARVGQATLSASPAS